MLWRVTGTCDITYTCHGIYTCSETHDCDSCRVTDDYNFFRIAEPEHEVYKKQCKVPLCKTCYIADFCANENESYHYTVDCVKTNYNNFGNFTSGHGINTSSLSFYKDVVPELYYAELTFQVPRISSLPAEMTLHEDTDEETLLHHLEVYDYNNDRPSDGHELEDNSTCWIEHVFDQWGENDMELFELEEDPNNPKRWNSYTLYKRQCIVPNSLYNPPCGFKRENYTCPKHTGCMTYNVTQCFDFAEKIAINLREGSEHDIIFSTMYSDEENENLTYEYTFIQEETGLPVTYFKGDPSGNYYNQLGNISLTTYLYDTPKNKTYKIQICGHDRRNEICDYLTVELKEYCGTTPECSSDSVTNDTELAVSSVIFNVQNLVTNPNSFQALEYSLTTKHPDLFEINSTTGLIRTTSKIPAKYPSTTYVLNAFVTDVDSCGTYSVCPLFLHVTYVNYPLNITNLPNASPVKILEDEDTNMLLYTIETYDRNPDDDVLCSVSNPDENKPFYIDETFKGSGIYVIKNHVAGTNTERQLVEPSYTITIRCVDSLGDGDTGNLSIDVIPNTGPTLTTLTGTLKRDVDQSTVFMGMTLITERAMDAEGDSLNYTCTVDNSNNPLTCFVGTCFDNFY
ncbi:uncharacterized protein LOC127852420 [Dreissena polymorpha]|uniref:uncharacterized protein LOC127852420 n=1 Tax=Dreissena polymorpha TaxID=45954 RepID=UPI0022649E3F|nr:uncharacterized protein LOC127852420 [Dreissena polymorpha]